jgi:hypothetical protein
MTSDRLRQLADAATPGPWYVGWPDGSGERSILTDEARDDYSVPCVVAEGTDDWGIKHGVLRYEDAALIAALGPDAARLLADAMELVGEIGWAEEPTANRIGDLLARFAALGEAS